VTLVLLAVGHSSEFAVAEDHLQVSSVACLQVQNVDLQVEACLLLLVSDQVDVVVVASFLPLPLIAFDPVDIVVVFASFLLAEVDQGQMVASDFDHVALDHQKE